jgi:hypothetical protein
MCTPPVWRLSRRSEFDTEIDGGGTSTDRGDAPLERDEGVATFATGADVRLSVGPNISRAACQQPVDRHAIPLLSAENQLGGAARNHVGRGVCPRPRNDLWHHGGVCHA